MVRRSEQSLSGAGVATCPAEKGDGNEKQKGQLAINDCACRGFEPRSGWNLSLSSEQRSQRTLCHVSVLVMSMVESTGRSRACRRPGCVGAPAGIRTPNQQIMRRFEGIDQTGPRKMLLRFTESAAVKV